MRAVKREILTLLSTWVAKAEDTVVVLESFVPPLFDAVLFDYQTIDGPVKKGRFMAGVTGTTSTTNGYPNTSQTTAEIDVWFRNCNEYRRQYCNFNEVYEREVALVRRDGLEGEPRIRMVFTSGQMPKSWIRQPLALIVAAFRVFLLSDQCKTQRQRANLIERWNAEGGVPMLGYDLCRLLVQIRPVKENTGKRVKP